MGVAFAFITFVRAAFEWTSIAIERKVVDASITCFVD
jgi:hypothetical protein